MRSEAWFARRTARLAELEHPYGKCQCGCGADTPPSKISSTNRLLLAGEPTFYLKGHQRRRKGPDYEIRDRGFETPCWEWLGRRHPVAPWHYGRLSRDGETAAHRWYYKRAKGEIPEGLVLHHLCENPPCVNPDHLEPVTNATNIRLGKSTLTPEIVRQIRTDPLGNRRAARKYGISRQSILGIRARRRWADVP